jgi:hypothetical protein
MSTEATIALLFTNLTRTSQWDLYCPYRTVKTEIGARVVKYIYLSTVTCAVESFVFGTQIWLFALHWRVSSDIYLVWPKQQETYHKERVTEPGKKYIYFLSILGHLPANSLKIRFVKQVFIFGFGLFSTVANRISPHKSDRNGNKQMFSNVPYFHAMSHCPWCFCRNA